MSDDDTRAQDALSALQQLDTERMEYKADIAPAVLDIDNRDVTTLFSVDNLDSVGDITPVSAFKRSLDQRAGRIPHLFMHDLHAPAIARIVSFQPLSRAELPTDVQREHADATGGMACVSRYLKSGRGAEVFEGIKEGIGYQASFGYRVVNAEKKTLKDGRTARVIKELTLFEISTTLPGHAANAATRVMPLKALIDYLTEYKAGRRHSATDLDLLNEIIALAVGLGGTYRPPAEPDPLFGALTSEMDALLSDVASILGEPT